MPATTSKSGGITAMSSKEPTMDKGSITCALHRLLAAKHSEDVYIPECKSGPTWGNGRLMIFDGWAMVKSYAHPAMIGYEVKSHRNDFLQDEKWPGYLPFCNQLYFVCPDESVISKSEVPEQCGLYVASKNFSMLYLKKKAPRREVEIPTDFFCYILFSRARIGEELKTGSNVERMRQWLAEKDEKKQIGHDVAWKLRHLMAAKIRETVEENRTLKNEMEGLKELKRVCEKLGVNPLWLGDIEFKVEEKLREFKSGFNRDFFNDLGATINQVGRLSEMLETIKQKLEIKGE